MPSSNSQTDRVRAALVAAATTFAIATAFAVTSGAEAAAVTKVSLINADQTVPAAVSTATGCAHITIDTETNTLDYRIVFSGLVGTETVAHFHGPANIGASAGVQHTLPPGNPKVGTWTYDEALEADILEGRIYINIHSTTAPSGEIRGQVVDMVALIEGAQAGTPSLGSGFGLFRMDTEGNKLTYHIEFNGVIESVAHIHGFAGFTDGAGIKHSLPAGSPKTGAWSFSEKDEASILEGLTYVNIHSALFPSGEIRGQISRNLAVLDGDQETTPSGSPGHGCAIVAIDRDANELSYILSHANLTGPTTGQHLHGFAPPGANAAIRHTIANVNPAVGTWTYLDDEEGPLLDGLTYFNVHTVASPSGEVRGQLEFAPLPCQGDIDCDGSVGFTDLLAVLSTWGPCDGCAADLDDDGSVGFTDLLIVLSSWGPCP
ncbi:MAG: CHRD domain-containing protein [Phycisphaerales bacterium]|nr:CHRD domain-containing protein [Phycisphaerae bacterium]NNF44896.1 CHRD domain-containing protein [Phycisphaerales bacterium]NNM27844.1 CHRD domain-containing protein [Phycisphaerales bacterium]